MNNKVLAESDINALDEKQIFEVTEAKNVNLQSFSRIELTEEQKGQMSMLVQHFPAMLATETLANAYKVVIPNGVTGTLTPLRQGGLGTMLRNENGKIVGTASMFSLTPEAAALGIFTAMSVVTGQYFLAQINKRLDSINSKLDDVLSFLYGDKKAELLSEISFVQFACDNYDSIMSCNEQRIATITGFQNAKKTSMKDIEFYLSDLDNFVSSRNPEKPKYKNFNDFKEAMSDKNPCEIVKLLQLSLQLYVVSGIMEIYFARNFSPKYINSLGKSAETYVNKCNHRISGIIGRLDEIAKSFMIGGKGSKHPEIEEWRNDFNTITTPLNSGEKSPILLELDSALSKLTGEQKCYITPDGAVYIEER